MASIIEASQLPEGEKVYLKKDFLGWRVVEPISDLETGKLNWLRLIFGSKRTFVGLLIISLIALALYFGINELIANYKLIANAPCDYCERCYASSRYFTSLG